MSDTRSSLRLNLGFVIHQTIGYSRDFLFDIPKIQLDSDLELDALNGLVKVTRTPQGLLVQVKLQATSPAECVRCLSFFDQELKVDFSELYAFNYRSVTESNLLLPEDGKIDLAPLLREFMLLELPINPLCKPDCKGLCPVCGENLNQTNCKHDLEAGDPRLANLQSLLDSQLTSYGADDLLADHERETNGSSKSTCYPPSGHRQPFGKSGYSGVSDLGRYHRFDS